MIERGTDAYQAWVDSVVASKAAAQRERDLALRDVERLREQLVEFLETLRRIEEYVEIIDTFKGQTAIAGIVRDAIDAAGATRRV